MALVKASESTAASHDARLVAAMQSYYGIAELTFSPGHFRHLPGCSMTREHCGLAPIPRPRTLAGALFDWPAVEEVDSPVGGEGKLTAIGTYGKVCPIGVFRKRQ